MFPFCCLLKIFVYIYNMNVNKNQKVMKTQLKFKEEVFTIKLDKIELLQLDEFGVKSLIPRIKEKLWIHLKLRGEKVTKSEIKFLGIIK